MGHVHLGTLPGRKKWREVVALLTGGASDDAVFAASAAAAEKDLIRAANDPVYVEAVRLLLAVPTAARRENFPEALNAHGLVVGRNPELFDLLVAISVRLDEVARLHRGRTDLGELAGRALTGALSATIGDRLPGLIEADAGDVQRAARALSWPTGIATLTRAFYGRLVSDTLSYWLDRTLATHVGAGARFASAADRAAFDAGLTQYTSETTRIIKEFSSGRYGKHVIRNGKSDSHSAAAFGAVALKKILSELCKRQADHD